jgi:hypothetical protein
MTNTSNTPPTAAREPAPSAAFSVYHFCVVCPRAREVYVIGEFNNWSTTATPMAEAEPDTWQLSLLMPAGQPPHRFSYFVIAGERSLRSDFSTSVLPGCWAVVEESEPSAFRSRAAAVRVRARSEARTRRPLPRW